MLEIENVAIDKTYQRRYQEGVQTGFGSPAEDYLTRKLDLHEYLIKNSPATYFMRVGRTSSGTPKICKKDLLIVDRSIPISHDKLVVVFTDGKLQLSIVKYKKGIHCFFSHETSEQLPALCELWGVVTTIIHQV